MGAAVASSTFLLGLITLSILRPAAWEMTYAEVIVGSKTKIGRISGVQRLWYIKVYKGDTKNVWKDNWYHQHGPSYGPFRLVQRSAHVRGSRIWLHIRWKRLRCDQIWVLPSNVRSPKGRATESEIASEWYTVCMRVGTRRSIAFRAIMQFQNSNVR